jgi:bifunctional DNA-binding transcriptional regulator/antitoxin component of YhaV-PrlF toxin-antitoxin module
MAEKEVMDAILRPKRQLTLPRGVCEQLGIGPGDVLELSLEGDTLVARPRKKAALEALKEIWQAFERSGITAEELQEAGRQVRQEVTRERDSVKA